jgi:DNA repair exonuclease SbcCD ATPase subunit
MSEPSKEAAMEKAREMIGSVIWNLAPNASQDTATLIALEFTNYQKRIESISEILNKAGVAVGNEHEAYTLETRIQHLIDQKEYAWRRYNQINKRIEELEKCEKWLLHTEDCMNYSKCRCGLDEFKSQLAKGVKEG